MLIVTDTGYVLSLKPMNERSALAKVFCAEKGVYSGAVRLSSKGQTRAIFQPGNQVQMQWKARLAEHLGNITAECISPHAALLLNDAPRLNGLLSALTLIEMALPEHEPHPYLYRQLEALVHSFDAPGDGWLREYIRFELELLRECGFRLDLSACAATGSKDDLAYVSPKSGRAVCRDAGLAYHDKLLPLPPFLLPDGPAPSSDDTLSAFDLTGYFLENWLLLPHERRLPSVRQRLISNVKNMLNLNAEPITTVANA